ncbi:hypothetical protein ACFL2Q_02535 [Thermodesulfobacteriota bacterium]
MLNPTQAHLWQEYVAAESDRISSVSGPALDRFLKALDQDPVSFWEEWAFEISRKHVDSGDVFPIRMQLFKRALFPALLSGIERQIPGCARWLAGMNPLLYHCKECQEALGEIGWSRVSLLRLALQHDQDDRSARKALIQSLATSLDYAIDEVPAGVLYGQKFATVEQCEELLSDLIEFRELVTDVGLRKRHLRLIRECEFHFGHYKDYLKRQGAYPSYEHYLKAVDA